MGTCFKTLGVIQNKEGNSEDILKIMNDKGLIYHYKYLTTKNIIEVLIEDIKMEAFKNTESQGKKNFIKDKNNKFCLETAIKNLADFFSDFQKFFTNAVVTPDGSYYADSCRLGAEWVNNYRASFLTEYDECVMALYEIEVEENDIGGLKSYTKNIYDNVKFEKTEKLKYSDYEKIKDEPIFLIEHTGGGWSTFQDTFIITEKGSVYRNIPNQPIYINGKTVTEIEGAISKSTVKFIKNIDNTEMNNLLSKVSDVRTDSKGYVTGVGMDGGNISYYVINKYISDKPILIGIRCDTSLHSKNDSEEYIANWLEKNIY